MSQLITLATQTGVCSYNFSLEAFQTQNSSTNQSCFVVGVTGVSGNGVFAGFSGKNGMLYDTQGNFFGGYLPNATFNLSGFIYPTYYNYFLNGDLKNTNCARPTGYLEGIFIQTGSGLSNYNVNINGNQGYTYISGGLIGSGQATGKLLTFNTSPSGIVRYQFLSGSITAGSYSMSINNSGWLNGEWDFPLITSNPTSTSGMFPITGTFYTNFGVFTTGVNVTVEYDLSLALALFGFSLGGSGITGTGIIGYSEMLGGDIVENEALPISIMLKNSGIVSTNPILNQNVRNLLLTGATVVPIPVLHFSGYITGSGFLNSLDVFQATGFNYYLNSNDTGTMSASVMVSVFEFATGIYNIPWNTIGSGQATGYALLLLPFTGGISGNFKTQFNISGSGLAYYVSGINGTGYSNTFNSLEFSLFSGTGYSTTTIAFATGTGFFYYTGASTGYYNIGVSGFSLYVGSTVATGIVSSTQNLTGAQGFSANWTANYQLTDQAGNINTFSTNLTSGTGFFTGNYKNFTGEMYLTGNITGIGYTGAGFIYSSGNTGFQYSGSWNFNDSGISKFLNACSGFATGTPLFAINTGAIYTGDFLTTNIVPTIVTGQSGFILLSNIGSPNVDFLPSIFITGGDNATNYLTNNVWIKHTNHKNGVYVYSIAKYKGLGLSGLNIDISPNGINFNLNTFLCKASDLTHFATGFYTTYIPIGQNTLITNFAEGNYQANYGSTTYDTGVYIRFASNNINPVSGVFMFIWQSGQNLSQTNIYMSGEQKEGNFTGSLFSGTTFAQELPTGHFTSFPAAEGFFTGFTGNYAYFPRVTGTQLTGIGTGTFQSGYINQIFNFTGETGAVLNDILIDPTGFSILEQIVLPVNSFNYPNNYQIGFLSNNFQAFYPISGLTGQIDFIVDQNGISKSINSNYNIWGFSGFPTGTSNVAISYTGGYTGQLNFLLGGNGNAFSGYISGLGIGLKPNPLLVTGRNFNFQANVTGNSLWTGIVNIYPYLTGYNLGYYSGKLMANAQITGLLNNAIIATGSGIYNLGLQTGVAINPITLGLLTVSGLVATSPFSGYPLPFTGITFFSDVHIGGSPISVPTGLFYGISYVETFSGEYTFYTGLNLNNMSAVPFLSPVSGFSGIAFVSGSGNIYYEIGKNFSLTGDTLILNASGYNQSTAQQIITTT